MGKRWLHMDKQTHDRAVAACKAQHEATGRGAISVAWNTLGLECVIKVAGADKPWRQSQAWMGECKGVYAEDDHDVLAGKMQGVDWRGVDPALVGV